MFRRITAFVLVISISVAVAAAPSAPAYAATTPVEDQMTWLINARVPLTATDIDQHLVPELVAAAGGVDGFNRILGQLGPFTAGPVLAETPNTLEQVVTGPAGELIATLTVGADGRLAGLTFFPYLPAPTSWAALDAGLGALAPRVSFAAERIDAAGRCQPAHEVNGATPRPLGSAFKLYVLGALAQAVAAHRLSWDQTLPIRDDWKSLPSGVLQDEPAGTPFTLEQYADYMIAISDNTAADHLIHEVGRAAVERQFTLFGNRDEAADAPLLTTREFFTLKGWRYPGAAAAYLALPRPLRAAALSALSRVPRTSIDFWTQPERIDSLEWFGSPEDLCRAFAGLSAQHDPHVGAALSRNDGGIGLPHADYPTLWFKGGSEPGVLTFNYLARSRSGGLVAASLMLSDPAHPLDESTVDPAALALLRGAIQLLH